MGWKDRFLATGGPRTMLGDWSGLIQPHPWSHCQLAHLLASFLGWLFLQVGEAMLSHGAFPDNGETARKTQSPQRLSLGLVR